MSPMEGRGSRVLGPRVYKDMRCVKDLLDVRGLTRQQNEFTCWCCLPCPSGLHSKRQSDVSFWSTCETSIRDTAWIAEYSMWSKTKRFQIFQRLIHKVFQFSTELFRVQVLH
jgi:hypothetical protein